MYPFCRPGVLRYVGLAQCDINPCDLSRLCLLRHVDTILPFEKLKRLWSYETSILEVIKLLLKQVADFFILPVFVFMQNDHSSKVAEGACRHRPKR
jgi:hypothetical protein